MSQGHNTPTGTRSHTSQEMEDRAMQVLPKPLTDWLRYEAAANYDIREIFRAWHNGVQVDRILSYLRGEQHKKTRYVYGPDHPEASFL